MSGLLKNSADPVRKTIAATARPPAKGDFVWDGADENERPLSKDEMREGMRKPMGRPRSNNPKVSTTIRLSPEVVEYFKAGGKGWQTRVDEVLKKYVGSHR